MTGPADKSSRVKKAFVLGAGLGTRLRPLTDRLPKPLVPLFHKPLAEWALLACKRAGIGNFAVNTHHLPGAWEALGSSFSGDFSEVKSGNGEPVAFRAYFGKPVALFHEPVLLETGGGLKNIAGWIGGDSVLVHNGDIFSTIPLERLIAAHEASGLPVTLALRSDGEAKHIALDESGSRVTDIRAMLGKAEGTHVFSGIYCISPGFLDLLPPGEKVSVIPAFLELASRGELGAIVLDEGVWLDLGDRASYLRAHRELALAERVHEDAVIEPGAVVEDSVVGPGAVVEAGAVVKNSVVWPGCRVTAGARLDGCIVFSGNPVEGSHTDEDL